MKQKIAPGKSRADCEDRSHLGGFWRLKLKVSIFRAKRRHHIFSYLKTNSVQPHLTLKVVSPYLWLRCLLFSCLSISLGPLST